MGLNGGNRVDQRCRLLRVYLSARATVGSESRCVAHREGGGVMDVAILKVIEDIKKEKEGKDIPEKRTSIPKTLCKRQYSFLGRSSEIP